MGTPDYLAPEVLLGEHQARHTQLHVVFDALSGCWERLSQTASQISSQKLAQRSLILLGACTTLLCYVTIL